MDIQMYFEPVDVSQLNGRDDYLPSSMGEVINTFLPEKGYPNLDGIDIAILGVQEDRMSAGNEGCALAPDKVRNKLYQLLQGTFIAKIADLGNIKRGHTVEDTYFAVAKVLSELIMAKILPVIIGGSRDLTYANYSAYRSLDTVINLIAVSPAFHLGTAGQELDASSYLSKIILHQPNYLFNYSNIGYQSYFVDQHALDLLNRLYFDAYRLGYIRSNMEEVEPIVRNADMMSFDISAVRHSDAPGNMQSTPNGLYGEEACQIVRYAGMSDKLTSIGFYGTNPTCDLREQTVHLVAQMIWYFIDGFYNRKQEQLTGDKGHFTKYHATIRNSEHEIIFYKSNLSNRWWMNVPYPPDKKLKYERHHLVPCSYNDYQTACKDDIPDRWLQAYRKLC